MALVLCMLMHWQWLCWIILLKCFLGRFLPFLCRSALFKGCKIVHTICSPSLLLVSCQWFGAVLANEKSLVFNVLVGLQRWEIASLWALFCHVFVYGLSISCCPALGMSPHCRSIDVVRKSTLDFWEVPFLHCLFPSIDHVAGSWLTWFFHLYVSTLVSALYLNQLIC